MKKVLLIIKREYMTRVRKRSFLVMTLLGPMLAALLYGLFIWIAVSEETPSVSIGLCDQSELFIGDEIISRNTHPKISYPQAPQNVEDAKDSLRAGKYDAVLFIPRDPVNSFTKSFVLFYVNRLPLSTVKYTEELTSRILEDYKLRMNDMSRSEFEMVRTRITLVQTKVFTDPEKEDRSTNDAAIVIAFINGFLVYILILVYGTQVLRGVMEEKQSRIVEVIISSVKPIQLMAGKILGIAAVGLTQFTIWIVFSGICFVVISQIVMGFSDPALIREQLETMGQFTANEGIADKANLELMAGILRTNLWVVLPVVFFFFVGGYLLYSSLFAAVGALVDTDSDTQQFMLPVTLPLIFSIALAQVALKNPDGNLALFLSIFPLTSPIVFPVKAAFEFEVLHLLIAMGVLLLSIVSVARMAAKIYRTGILMYGKRITWSEVFRWLFYGNG
jgi:ABC-2 type transport system permease protein